ncbi:hypothetical protein [Pseudacidovorax intermedius]|uniref:hypothetical protein n=1 Tax=Pseudacidovorax intermedius TaxID=433924 RepID=UPI0026F332C1|nr:hypothetical protein [Pseudacidovorax intermedius]
MNQTIQAAIHDRRVLELRYNGYSRTVEPHAYGRDRGGEEILRCFQVAGGSESGERTGWKLLKVADVYSVTQTSANFSPKPEYKRGDKAMQYIFCEL